MRAIDILHVLEPMVVPATMKLHLATSNGTSNPLDEYLAGGFPEWQRWQSRKNFELSYVLSLIALPTTDHWLFAGVYASSGCVAASGSGYYYTLQELDSCSEFSGRLVVRFQRPGRQPYLYAETYVDQILLAHILPERMTIAPFKGFKAVDISKSDLNLVVEQNLESWRAALSSVAGVYLISDTVSGKLYVGSATGAGGIWQRWSQYAYSHHGGNVEIKALLAECGVESANGFRFSVLEIADTHASLDDVLARESHWKKVLLSIQPNGLNCK